MNNPNVKNLIRDIKKRRDLAEVVHHEVLRSRKPTYADPSSPLTKEMAKVLADLGITRLYDHQAKGIDAIREGRNVVVMTPTASGKSLVYNIPVFESMLEDPNSRALYLFPLKGLEQDQLKAAGALARGLGIERPSATAAGKGKGRRRAYTPGIAEIYDGDTSAYRRRKIRESPPGIVLTNPDMLHLAINAYHEKWETFFRNLKYVIVDEVHTYRGVFGSHVAHVLRRLRRIAAVYGSHPVFIACSATIANASELAGMLTGLDFTLIDESGAATGKRNFIFINPPREISPYTTATKLFTASVASGLKTIAFTKARKITELMHAWVKESLPELAPVISSYRAGFLPEQRREIERRLFAGELTGVISTSALELGVDIGGLDVCILVGYPGTVSSTWQRAGRVGRSGRESLIVMVGMPDALDQYFMRNPADFFARTVEAAVLDVQNPIISKEHLLCATAETHLKSIDEVYDVSAYQGLLEELEAEKSIRYWAKGNRWWPRQKHPQREVSIREAGETYLILRNDGVLLGTASSTRVARDLHPGAVYLHSGAQYLVKTLDMNERKVWCRTANDVAYYTRAETDEESEILSVEYETPLSGTTVKFGKLRITEQVSGYIRKKIQTGETLAEFPLDLPPSVFTTTGIWMDVDPLLLEDIKARSWSPAGSLHALEHAAIAALPLFALCDRMDLGGVSYTFNPELRNAAIFIYDGHEGGVGLAHRGFECLKEWFRATMRLMEECTCEVSCPSCTHDPHCGNNNDPLDKRGAVMILKAWLAK